MNGSKVPKAVHSRLDTNSSSPYQEAVLPEAIEGGFGSWVSGAFGGKCDFNLIFF
jgi:hypothetical protein